MSGPCTDCGGPDYQTLEARIAELEAELRTSIRQTQESQRQRDKAEAKWHALRDKLEYVGAHVGFEAWQAMRDFDAKCEGGGG